MVNFQLPVPNISQFAFYTLIHMYAFNVAFESYSEQNNLLMGGGVPLADFSIMLSRLAFSSSIIYCWLSFS